MNNPSTQVKPKQIRNRHPALFLVMLECTWDDVPLRICTSRKEAEKFIAELSIDTIYESMAKLLERDLTDPLNVSIIRFNASGFPKRHTIERDLDNE